MNNTGIGSPRDADGERVAIEGLSEEQWDLVMDVNAKGVFLGTKTAIPEMIKTGRGSIINISAGLVGGTTSAYGASKGAVRLLAKSTASQYTSQGIRANSVHPGVIITDITADVLADEVGRELNLARNPIGRLDVSEDVAYGVLFLASDGSSFVTDRELVIDGWLTAQ